LQGQGVQVLVGATLVAKNSLNIDISAKRVYWVDRETVNQLVSIGYDGSGRTLHLSSLSLFTDSPLSATHIFGDYIYWTDNRNDSILRVNMRDTSEAPAVEVVVQSGVDINAMNIYHKSVQPMATNKCVHHLCPQLRGNTRAVVYRSTHGMGITVCLRVSRRRSIDVQCFGKI
ncbi:unnamed protein product, partial [Oppiella nova]